MSTPKPSDVEAAVAALDTVRRRWLRVDGVTAVDVGFKVSDGTMTDTLALRVHVARKRPVAELAASAVFNVSGAGRTVDGFPVDVLEARYGPATQPLDIRVPVGALEPPLRVFVDRRGRTRPVRGGISVGNPRVTAGTLGAVVFQRTTGRAMLLSNFHVLAGARAAAAGEAVLQPGSLDGGRDPADRVATLRRMRLDTSMDAAVADLDPGVEHDLEVVGVGDVTGTTAPTLGMLVVKSGRSTAVTQGVVDGVSLTAAIDYGGDVGVVTLTDQVHIVPRPPWPAVDDEVSMGGDSGSVWLEESTRRAVALHFGGETDPVPSSENALATPIDRVVAEFGVSFLPVPVRLPSAGLCDRFPRLCALVAGPVVPPVPVPDPGPLVDLGLVPLTGPVPFALAARVPQARVPEGGCGCRHQAAPVAAPARGAWDEQARLELRQLLTELGR